MEAGVVEACVWSTALEVRGMAWHGKEWSDAVRMVYPHEAYCFPFSAEAAAIAAAKACASDCFA